MPNHVINEVAFRTVDNAQQERILAAACNGAGAVDFSILVPLPLNMWWGNVGAEHEAAFKQTALDWSRLNWGTKWNAYDHRPVEREDGSLVLRFETAWSPPYPWLAAIFNHLSLPFDHHWMSEGGSPARAGRFEMSEAWGPRWNEVDADDRLSRHLHKLLWGVEEFTEDEANPPQPHKEEGG